MKALSGMRILELTHMVSGPYAGMILADLGAETIKVEPPGHGEMTRGLMAEDPKFNVGGMGPYFLSLNRNKKSVTVNLKSDRGLDLFYDLVRVSDVVLNNFRVGVVQRLKIDHERLVKINPRIITCTISGFGETGPDKDLPSYDIVAQAMSGTMSITGQPDGPPTRAGIPIADMNGSLMGVTGILAALVARNSTGLGQHVDISMLDAQISTLNYAATIYFLSEKIPTRLGNAHINHVPYDVYPCRDGYIILAVVTNDFWKKLVEVLKLSTLDSAENQDRTGRMKNRERINQELRRILITRGKRYWLEKLRSAGIPSGPVNNFTEAFAESQVQARDMAVEIEYPGGERVGMPGNPIKLSETKIDSFTPSPQLGQHNQAIFGDLLGKTKAELKELKRVGAI